MKTSKSKSRIFINAVQTAIVATGIFFSIASLFGAIIYWNHNRG